MPVAIDTYANRPVSATSVGEVYRASDSPLVSVWNGASWDTWHPTAGLVEVPETGWTKRFATNNPTFTQGALQGDGVGGSSAFIRPHVSGDTHTFFITQGMYSVSSHVAFYDSISGRGLMTYLHNGTGGVGHEALLAINVSTYPTVYNSNLTNNRALPAGLGGWWMRLRDDGVNISFDVSNDGNTWRVWGSQARTGYLTNGPDYIGVGNTPNAALWHYKKT